MPFKNAVNRCSVTTIETVLDLDRLGVQVISVKESWLDTSGTVLRGHHARLRKSEESRALSKAG